MIKITVDPDKVFQRELTALEQKKLPWATQQAVNRAAAEIKQVWAGKVEEVFDRPVALTRNAVIVKKARYIRNADGTRTPEPAEIYIRNKAARGTPPAKYLLAQVYGGARAATGLEVGLQRLGILSDGQRAVPGEDMPTDGHGNVGRGVVKKILSQLGTRSGARTFQSPDKRQRRRKREARRATHAGDMFVVRGTRWHGYTLNRDGSQRPTSLRPGIYQYARSGGQRGSLHRLFVFVRSARYSKLFNIFDYAQREWDRRFPGIFREELHKAVMESLFRGRK